MFMLREKTYDHLSRKMLDYLIGVFLLILFILPFIFIQQIGNFVFPILLKNSRDALGLAALLTISTLALPLVGGIITFLISRRRKAIFQGFLLGIPILLVVWVVVVGFQQDQAMQKERIESNKKISELQKQIDYLKKKQIIQPNNNTTTTEDTSSWQTYSDSVIGYSIKYPSNLFIYKDITREVAEQRNKSHQGGGPLPMSQILFGIDPSDLTLTAVEHSDYTFFISTYKDLSVAEILNGDPNTWSTKVIDGVTWTTRISSDGTPFMLAVNRNSVLYYINITEKTLKNPILTQRVGAVLDTFKFTK